MLSQRFLRVPLLFLILFFFSALSSITLPVQWCIFPFFWSAVEPLCCIFQFSNCILPLCNFYLVFSYVFCLFVEIINCDPSILPFQVRWTSLWPIFWILYQLNCWSPCYKDFFPEVLPCSFIQDLFLYFLILPDSLYLFLCIRQISYFCQSWRSGLGLKPHGAQKYNLP